MFIKKGSTIGRQQRHVNQYRHKLDEYKDVPYNYYDYYNLSAHLKCRMQENQCRIPLDHRG